jgi:hemerythrin
MLRQPHVTIAPAASPDGVMAYSPPALPVTGYRELDEAHEKLSMRLADLGAQIESGAFSSAITTAVALLFELREDYAIEEALMFRTGYPDYARHQASHAVLEQTFSNLSRWIRSAESGAPGAESRAEVLALLNTGGRMLAAHVLGADVALTKYVMGRDPAGRPGSA